MSLVSIALGTAAISTGLFAGLVLTMLFIFQPLLNQLSATEYVELMQRFLGVARRAPINLTLMFASILAPIPALFGFYRSANWLGFGLAGTGLIIFFVGMFLVSRWFNEPLYDRILSWTAKTPPLDWETARQEWYLLNIVRACASGSALVLFLIALRI
ncbi:MAG: DUF1772 domain-containing protein [Cyanosarcina radialis HA8281-LM2]|nr:DUF1772 domain-containing protein [Cyanosarcina radialis HA8281-LM2]